MKTFERPLRKVIDKNGRLKEYSMSLGVNTEINEDRFYQNDKGKILCDVIIGFPDEYEEFCHEHEILQTEIGNLQSEIQALKESHDAQEKTIKMLQDELSNIEEEHQKEIKKLDDEYSAKIDELNAVIHEKDLEIERTKTRYEKEIGELKESNQKEINSLELYDEESHMSIIEHQSEVFDLKEAQWKEISGIKDKIVMETIHHNDNLNSHEKNLNLLGYIRGDYKSSFQALKEDIEAFKYIAQYIESKENLILPEVKIKEDDEDSS